MADIDRMFRCELAVLADQPTQSDLWGLDLSPFDADDPLDILAPDPALGLFPAPDRRLGGPPTPDLAPQPTVRLSDLSLSPPPASMPTPAPIQIPPAAPPTASPTDSFGQTDFSSSDMDSDFDLAWPSDSDFLPSPMSIDPASLSAPSTATATDPHAFATRPSRRASRSMTKVPVPIPNLTKKSRGRKVPTSLNGEPVHAASRDKTKKGVRNYTCHVDGCGKCFVRGEHLKRHIRSIHTDEKRGWDLSLGLCFYCHCSRFLSLIGSPFFFLS